MVLIDIPASLGVQGPGEITIFSGSIISISFKDIISFLTTLTSQPSSPKYWTMLYVNES